MTNLILVSGFLGSGKTTVIRHMLDILPGRTGIIVNEFGKAGLDGQVLHRPGIVMTELNNGSIFCQCLAGRFVDSIAEMLACGLDQILIESTGLADPSNMKDMLAQVKHKTTAAYTYSGVLCVIDAVHFRRLSQSLETINRQILASSLIVINKVDRVDEQTLASVERSVSRLNPLARVVHTTYGQIDLAELQRLRRSRLSRLPSLNTPQNRPQSLLITTGEPMRREQVLAFVERLRDQVYRMKGLLRLIDGYYRLDVVGGEASLEGVNLDGDRSELVIIARPDQDLRRDMAAQVREILQVTAEIS